MRVLVCDNLDPVGAKVLEEAGIGVDADESRSHVVRALHVCRLALAVPDEPPEAVLPDYLREPDAKPRQ